MGQDVGARRSDIQPLKHALDSGEVFGIFLRPFEQLRVFRVLKQLAHLAAEGKGGHIFLCGEDIIVNNSGP